MKPVRKSDRQRLSPSGQQSVLHLVALREHSLLSLFELSNGLSVELDVYGITDLALFNLMGHMGTVQAGLWLRTDAGPGDLVLIRSHGLRRELAAALGGVLAAQLKADIPLDDPCTVESGDLLPSVRALAEQSKVAVLAPVLVGGKTVGVVVLGPRASGLPYSDLDLQLLRASLSMVGSSIENARLYNQLQEQNRRLTLANDELRVANELRTQFLQNVNHELRTPLTIIIGFLDCLLQQPGLDTRQRGYVESSVEEATKLKGMIQSLLEFSEATQNRLDVHLSNFDVVALLADYHRGRRPGIAGGLRELVLESKPGPLPARGDIARFLGVVESVVENSVKFTPEGSRIAIGVDDVTNAEGRWVRVGIADDGPGIPQEHLPHLLEPFRQVDGSTTRMVGGMGLGLASSARLMHLMGGRIEVQSELGRGTLVELLLPRA